MNNDDATSIFPSYSATTNKRILQKNCNTNESQVIEKLYGISQTLFTDEFINILFKIYDMEEFNILNFGLFDGLTKCDMFMEYLKNDNTEKNKSFEKIFNIYFNVLSHTRLNINSVVFKNKICSLLKMTIKVPSYRSGIGMKYITANISTSFKPNNTDIITARCDIVNVIKEGFFKSINNSNIERFNFSPQISTVVIQGPLLKQVLNGVMNLQSQLMQAGKSHGVKVEPFIENTQKKLEI
ncbi:hypothetical protein QKT26_gp98 [Carcinus maenas nudivirus]|uniref:Uncharacterized protein n=1 Tax=Carcinus maenas nudivirus TaxID=2880837 RepID=A0AAE8Y3J4_9VIRU|nr:hypothetical protein QKT26_gp98 [Carcinus maenas nudivirus]UBZ25688.1 hypothetical protein CmNV_097 [Carcinus maenas nudivirus]